VYVAATGVVIGVSVGVPEIPASVILLYPILALFMATGWVYNGLRILCIGGYLRNRLDTQGYFSWESYLQCLDRRDYGVCRQYIDISPKEHRIFQWSKLLENTSVPSIFLLSQLLTFMIGLSHSTCWPRPWLNFVVNPAASPCSTIDWILVTSGVVAFPLTGFALWRYALLRR
jgi:hypothetical protein